MIVVFLQKLFLRVASMFRRCFFCDFWLWWDLRKSKVSQVLAGLGQPDELNQQNFSVAMQELSFFCGQKKRRGELHWGTLMWLCRCRNQTLVALANWSRRNPALQGSWWFSLFLGRLRFCSRPISINQRKREAPGQICHGSVHQDCAGCLLCRRLLRSGPQKTRLASQDLEMTWKRHCNDSFRFWPRK